MTLLNDGKTQIPIRATSLARLYYKQEFRRELDEDITLLRGDTNTGMIGEMLYRMVWAMAKADCYYRREPMPGFTQWLLGQLEFDLAVCVDMILEEIKNGFTIVGPPGGKPSAPETGNNSGQFAENIICICLRLGLSFEEINELTTQSLVDIMRVSIGETEKTQTGRIATAAEATAFFS